jgi:geranylgeranyl diphosphate synthase type I
LAETLEDLIITLRQAVEEELRQIVARSNGAGLEEFRSMIAYHLGWEGQGAGPAAQGKRIRPLLVLLTAAASGGKWQNSLPAAASVELLHNFSLVHDDIEDNSSLRRGRQTLWKKYGIAQAINTGDTIYTLAFLSLHNLEKLTTPAITLKGFQILSDACLQLTQGQYLDLSSELRGDLTLESYWPMVNGKTAALLSACAQLGALVSDASAQIFNAYRQFGRYLGLAFQAQDDLLGMWGDAALTGKSNESDLASRKKSLPVLYGLSRGGEFAQRWAQGPFNDKEVRQWANQLTVEGAREFTQAQVEKLTQLALEALEDARPLGLPGEALHSLALELLRRQA